MHLPSAAVSCSDAKPNTISPSSYSSRKTSLPITDTTSIRTSSSTPAPPRRRPRSIRLRRHHPTRRKGHHHHHNSPKRTSPPATALKDPHVLIEAPNIDRDINDVGVHAGVYLADREHRIHEGRRRRVSGTHSTPRRAQSSDRPHPMRLADTGKQSQEADIPKEATSILS